MKRLLDLGWLPTALLTLCLLILLPVARPAAQLRFDRLTARGLSLSKALPKSAAESGITSPVAGDAVMGTVTIRGTAVIDNFQRYEIYLIPDGGLVQRIWLTTVEHGVVDGPLFEWFTPPYPDGRYSLQLRLVTQTGDYRDYYTTSIYLVNQARIHATADARATAAAAATLTATARPPGATAEPTEPPTPTPTPTATATPLIATRVMTITEPLPGVSLRGVVTIRGTANVTGQVGYQLHVGLDNGEGFDLLRAIPGTVQNGVLGVWNTRRWPDGAYALRLRVKLRGGELRDLLVGGFETANETPLPIPTPTPTPILAGPGIYGPRSDQAVSGQVRIWGWANAPGFVRYDLHVARAGSADWLWLASSSQPIERNTLALWDTARYPPGRYDLRLRIVFADGNYDEFLMPGVTVVN